MADNIAATPGSGATIRTFDDGTAEWPGDIPGFITGGSAGAWTIQYVQAANGLPVHQQTGATWAVSAASLPLPSGASTAAKQPALGTAGTASSDVITVQGIAAMTPLLATLSGTNNIATVTTVSAVTEITNALPAGTNNIGDVDVLSVIPGTGATNLGKAEDAIHSSGDTGVMILGVRQDSQVDFGADGDYVPFSVDADGGLRVSIVAGAGSGGTAMSDDAAFTAATTSFTPVGGIVTADSVDSGDGGAFAMLANRQQKVTLYDSGGVELAVGGGTQYTEDAAAAANPVGNAINLVRQDTPATNTVTADGDNIALRGSSSGAAYVELISGAVRSTILDLTNSNPLAVAMVDTDGTQVTPSVDATHDSAVSADGPQTMARASAAAPTDVSADNDAVQVWALRNGSPVCNLAVGGTLVTGSAGLPAAQQGTWNITNVSGTVSLPTGAATAAKQPALGTAGTASTDVITVQGIAAMTPLLATLSGTNDIATVTTVTTVSTLTSITNWGNIVDDAAFTPGTTRVSMSGFQADETATDSVDEGDGGAARMTLDRKIITTPQPHTTGGLSIFRSLDLDETEEDVKTSAGQIYGGFISNLATSTRFVKFYNATAANVTVGTTTPVITLPIPGNATDDIAAVLNLAGGMGIAFDTAISVAATTGLADNDTGAPGANEVVVNLFYK